MKRLQITPYSLQYVMVALCLIILTATVVGFYYAQTFLANQIAATDHARLEAESIQDDLSALKSLHTYLDNPENTNQIKKTAAIVGDSKQFMYQNQVVDELTKYAKASSVTLGGFDFESGNSKQAGTSGTSAKKTVVNVKIEKGTSYDSFLKFIKSIEQNVTKMQLSTLSLMPDDTNKALINETTVGIEVYLR